MNYNTGLSLTSVVNKAEKRFVFILRYMPTNKWLSFITRVREQKYCLMY